VNKTVEKIERVSLALLGIGALVGWAMNFVHVPSFLAGGVVMQLNFWLIKKIVANLLFRPTESPPGKVGAVFWILVKGAVFLLLLSGLFIRYPIEPLSFMAGVSLLVVTCVIVTFLDSWNSSRMAVSK
jgi:hypothetical protein